MARKPVSGPTVWHVCVIHNGIPDKELWIGVNTAKGRVCEKLAKIGCTDDLVWEPYGDGWRATPRPSLTTYITRNEIRLPGSGPAV